MQRFDVLDPNLNVLSNRFLEASAGTGKTFAIENLFVRWILEGIPVKEVLVVTFTKAATQELIERIHQRLQKTLAETEAGEKRLLLEAALASYDEAKIFTIHAFCQAMLRRYFLQAGCDLLFSEPLENGRSALWGQWIDFLRAHVDTDKCSAVQIERVFGKAFEITLRSIIRQWKPDIQDPLPDFSSVPGLIENALKTFEFHEGLRQDFDGLSQNFKEFTRYGGQYDLIAGWCERRKAAPEEIQQLLAEEVLFLEALQTAERKKKAEGPVPKSIVELQELLLPLLTDLRDKKKIQNKLCFLFSEYRKRFGESPATPDELLSSMQAALANEEFLKAVQGQFSCVVIDEFQDTDEVQWKIFSRLFMKQITIKSLTLVGDPKQSIYRFRNADLYTYLRAKEMFAPHEIDTLSVNYRSVSPLVEALNALFADERGNGWMRLPKLGQILDVPRVAAARFQEREEASLGNVHVVIAHRDEQQLFAYITSQIHLWKERNVLPKDMAILVKDRYEARDLIHYLHQRKIKTNYSSQGHLAQTATFEAVVDFLALLERPRDVSRLKKVLAGPLVAWPESSLKTPDVVEVFFGLQELVMIFDEKGLGPCLQAFFDEPWTGKGRISETLLLNDRLDRFEEFEQLFELLIEEIPQGNILQIRLFLEALRRDKNREGAELEKRSSLDDEAVQITTIFQSKGLEYEIVFPLALATSEQKEDDEESAAEKMRLLYVALTRAKQCVYLPWLISKPNTITQQFFSFWEESVDYKLIRKILEELGSRVAITVEELQEEIPLEPLEDRSSAQSIPSLSRFTKHYMPRLITSFSSMAKKEESVVEAKPTAEILPVGTETGIFVHGLFEKIFRSSLHHPYQKEAIEELISIEAEKANMLPAAEQLFQLFDRIFELPLQDGEATFTLRDIPPSSLSPEMEFVYGQNEQLIKGFIDLVFIYGDKYYIVDWKTNWLSEYTEQAIEDSIESHQYRLQAKIYAEALKRYVKLFDTRPFEAIFGGAYYLYIRGMQWIRLLP